MAEKTRVNAAGFVEGFDEATGKVLWTEKTKHSSPSLPSTPKKRGRPRGRPTKRTTETHHTILDGSGRKLWVPKGTNPDELPRTIYPFSRVTTSHICQMITAGHTLTDISDMEGFPPKATIFGWLREYPEFREEYEQARKDRALYFEEEAIRIARDTKEWSNKADRLKTDVLRWGASVNDPGVYGTKVKHSGDPSSPISFVVNTGIVTEEKPLIDVPSSPAEIESEE